MAPLKMLKMKARKGRMNSKFCFNGTACFEKCKQLLESVPFPVLAGMVLHN
jgi:hypothetical protein